MTTCHQCGSEVAENDVFCPFCGISLAPVAVPDAENDEFASTIMMPLPDKSAKAVEHTAPVKIETPAEKIPSEPALHEPAADQPPPIEKTYEPEVVIEPTVVEEPKPAIDYAAMPTPPA